MKKLAIFGIDGGSYSLIEKWKDELPTLGRIINEGISGEMMSTVPSLTCPAWISMFTGKNPGRLGIYDFISDDGRIINSTDYERWALWGIVNRYGRTVGLLNVPMTYPPGGVIGYVVSGVGTPSEKVNYTYPSKLKDELNNLVGGYEIIPNVMITLSGQEEKCLKASQRVLDKRIRVAKHLVKNYPTDMFICSFFVSDVVQHYFWRYMDDGGKYSNVIKDCYKRIDEAIGELMTNFANVIVVSDHGFGRCRGVFFLNKWLAQKGYLNYKKFNDSSLLYAFRDFILGRMSSQMVSIISRYLPMGLIEKLRTSGEQINKVFQFKNSIDWQNTVAYATGQATGGIYINEKEQYDSVRNTIIEELGLLGYRTFKREDVINGEYAYLAPDIYIELGSSEYYPLAFETKHHALSGSHTSKGIFMAYGENIGRGKIENASIYDVVPTVLYLLGIPIPSDIDGKPLKEVFEKMNLNVKERA